MSKGHCIKEVEAVIKREQGRIPFNAFMKNDSHKLTLKCQCNVRKCLTAIYVKLVGLTKKAVLPSYLFRIISGVISKTFEKEE